MVTTLSSMVTASSTHFYLPLMGFRLGTVITASFLYVKLTCTGKLFLPVPSRLWILIGDKFHCYNHSDVCF